MIERPTLTQDGSMVIARVDAAVFGRCLRELLCSLEDGSVLDTVTELYEQMPSAWPGPAVPNGGDPEVEALKAEVDERWRWSRRQGEQG